MPHRPQPGTGRRMVEHPDHARCATGPAPLRRIFPQPGYRAEHAHPAPERAGGGGPARTPALQPAPAALSVRAHGQGRGFSRRAHGFRRLGQSPLRRGRAERAARRANKRAAGALVPGGSRRWPNGTAGAMHRAGRACRQRGNAPAPGGHAGAGELPAR